MNDIKRNLAEVHKRIQRAADRGGRDSADIKLVAVSKTKTVPAIREAISAGHLLFGENRLQEAKQKIEALGDEAVWHMIGHLQTNKARNVVGLFELIHSIDSVRLAQELNKRCGQVGTPMNILIQVNVSGEESKHGAEKGETISLVKEISGLPNLNIKGLMTIPPFSTDPEDSRPHFRRLMEIRRDIADMGISGANMDEISMGMSGDYEVAIEEGATIVRIGTAIFGPRDT